MSDRNIGFEGGKLWFWGPRPGNAEREAARRKHEASEKLLHRFEAIIRRANPLRQAAYTRADLRSEIYELLRSQEDVPAACNVISKQCGAIERAGSNPVLPLLMIALKPKNRRDAQRTSKDAMKILRCLTEKSGGPSGKG